VPITAAPDAGTIFRHIIAAESEVVPADYSLDRTGADGPEFVLITLEGWKNDT
jgi:hypothetical protein